jgi:HK97 family phage prohead protease
MPYFITDKAADCSGWAVVDDAGEAYGCHTTKQDAIDQAVAISLNDDEPFEGERAAVDSLAVGDYVSWNVLDPEILAEVIAVEGQYAILRLYDYEDGVFEPTDKLMVLNIFKLEKVTRPEMVVEDEKYEPLPVVEPVVEPVLDPVDDSRAINQEAPAYMRAAARRGLEYYEQGLGGDGLVEQTIREAREMADGRISDDKWVRIAAWIARHLDDLDSPDANPESDGYPSAGVVAHLLWGSGPSKRAAERTLAFAVGVVDRIREEESKAMTTTTEARDKWLSVAWAIKSRLDGGEARSVGGIETRRNHITLEVREGSDGMTFEGYAAVFNSPSEPLPFTEVIAPGAFKRSLQGRHRMMLLWNHDASQPLASNRNGSLRMTEDAYGLKVEATLPNTQLGRDIAEMVRTNLIDAMSFGFQVKKDSWSADGSTRTLHEVAIHETSLVSFPAYEGTAGSVSVRSIDADVLADGLLRLESGEELSADQAATIKEVVDKLAATEEVQAVDGDVLALKKKKLDLLLKGM